MSRKGARKLTVNNISYSWFVGKKSTEIRNLETNKKIICDNESLYEKIDVTPVCPCCGESLYSLGISMDNFKVTKPGITPSSIKRRIQSSAI